MNSAEEAKLKSRTDVKLAIQPRPLRMAILVATFPLRKQVEEFGTKLGLRSAADVIGERSREPGPGKRPLASFRFLSVRVERRELRAEGQSWGPFRPLDVSKTYGVLLMLSGRNLEPEAPEFEPVLLPALVMPRVALFREDDKYPAVEARLEKLARTVKRLRERPAAPRGKPVVPEHCLVRILDADVEPGKTYRYRLQVRMANPNFGRKDVARPAAAAVKELTSPWYELPQVVRVGSDLVWYVIEQRRAAPVDLRQVALQAHRWLDAFRPGGGAVVPVGDWVVAERVPVYRGEYLGRKVGVEVPYWRYNEEQFVLAKAPRGDTRVEVDFSNAPRRGGGTVLVDFEQGRRTFRKAHGPDSGRLVHDESATEVLFLSPDGRLLARSSAADVNDPERVRRLREYRRRVDDVKGAGAPGK
jgi:hypothetical protein